MKITTQNPTSLVLTSRPYVSIAFLSTLICVLTFGTILAARDGYWAIAILSLVISLFLGASLWFCVEWITVTMLRNEDVITVLRRGWRSVKISKRHLSDLSDIVIKNDGEGDPSELHFTFAGGADPLILPATINGGVLSRLQLKALIRSIKEWRSNS